MAYPCYVLLNELVCGCEGWAHPLCFPLTQKTCPLCEQPLRTRRGLQLEKDPTRGFLDQLELARDTSPDVLKMCERTLRNSKDAEVLTNTARFIFNMLSLRTDWLVAAPALLEALKLSLDGSAHEHARMYMRGALVRFMDTEEHARLVASDEDFVRKLVWRVKHPRDVEDNILVMVLWKFSQVPHIAEALSSDDELLRVMLAQDREAYVFNVAGCLNTMTHAGPKTRNNLRTPSVIKWLEKHKDSQNGTIAMMCKEARFGIFICSPYDALVTYSFPRNASTFSVR